MKTTHRNHIQISSQSKKQVEGEGALRLLLLSFILVLPMASMAYLKIQQTKFSYDMSTVRNQISQQQELRKNLLLKRSHYQRGEEIQVFASQIGLIPRQQGHLIARSFTETDQATARNIAKNIAKKIQ